MIIATTIGELRSALAGACDEIGFVPTMGALHDGHISLMKKAREQNSVVVVSLFVNPTQFLAGEDFAKYPQKIEADKKICELAKVDIVFIPTIDVMYGKNEVGICAPQQKGYILDGYTRPKHFDGVLQVVLKFFHLIKPQRAYFGKKDAQQLILIEQMVQDLFLDVKIVACDLIRDHDGLALSSRNIYLNSQERQQALAIPKSLKKAAKLIGNQEYNIEVLMQEMLLTLEGLKVDYVAFVDYAFNPIEQVELGNTIILVAAYVGATRLIDNIWI